MLRRLFFMGLWLCQLPLSAAIFYDIDTTSPLQCYFSSQFQNRIMIEGGRIQKVIAAQCEGLSVEMEEVTGQVFVDVRDPRLQETTISVVTDTGVVQDIHIHFMERLSEVVVLKDPTCEEELLTLAKKIEQEVQNHPLDCVKDLLVGRIPSGYCPCAISPSCWEPKKGFFLTLKNQLEADDHYLYVYEATNRLKYGQKILECELQFKSCCWVFLEANYLKPKQRMLCIMAVAKDE